MGDSGCITGRAMKPRNREQEGKMNAILRRARERAKREARKAKKKPCTR